MLPALRESAPSIAPYRPTLAARTPPPEPDAPDQVAAEHVRVLPQPERRDGYVMLHSGIFAHVPRQW